MSNTTVFALLASLKVVMCECELSSSHKPTFCTDVTQYLTRTNEWVCRNCFNIRISFNLAWIGAVGYWWDNKDFIMIEFKQPVSVIKWQGPVNEVVLDKQGSSENYRFRVGFIDQFNPGDRNIDVNIEFNGLESEGEIVLVNTCPCSASVVQDICDPTGITKTVFGNGFWKCDWHRNNKAQQRMNRCFWRCREDDLRQKHPDWRRTGGKARCFREQGKNFKEGSRKQRILGKWEFGRKATSPVSCKK